jgi:hypothetical protein
MGSNPILPKLVSDTSPLQGLHRGGALETLRDLGVQLVIPVDAETRSSFQQVGGLKVPDLDGHRWIRTERVDDAALAAFGASLVGPHRRTFEYAWKGFKLDRPELEVVCLAVREGAHALVEDEPGIRCARMAGVPVTSVPVLLRDLVRAGRMDLADAGRRARAILETGYFLRELEWLSRGIDDF